MTTVSDTFTSPAGTGVGGVVVRATLVAASEVLTGGGAIIRETDTTTATDGTWSLTLTPISSLSVPDGAYYLVTADGHRWTIDVPASGTYTLSEVQVEPAPLPATGATYAQFLLRPEVRVYNEVTAEYDAVTGATFYVGGPTDPTVNDGDIWIDTGTAAVPGGPISTGERTAPGEVGYLGELSALTVITQDGSLVGTPFEGGADWFPGVLVVTSNSDLAIDSYHFDGVALFFSGSGDHLVTNCVIEGGVGQAYGLGSSDQGATRTIRDTTINYLGEGTAVGISDFLVMERCKVTGGENAAAFYPKPAATFADSPTISQCELGSQVFDDIGDHVDVIEVHSDPTLATKMRIQHCYITGVSGPGGVPISAGITMGQNSGTPGPLTGELTNNYIGAGTYHLRVEDNTVDCVVTNNNFGTVLSGEFGFVAVTVPGTAIATWTNNRDGSGDAGTGVLVDQP